MRRISLQIVSILLLSAFLLQTECKNNPESASGETVTDIDGNVYRTISIGDQIWMAENLRVTKFNDGTPIPNITDNDEWASLSSAGMCSYNNTSDQDTIQTYGRLYNWYAARSNKLCPAGWHVPSNDEFLTLRNFLMTHGYNYNGSKDATKNACAKSLASKSGWIKGTGAGSPGNTDYPDMQDASGFNGYPAGQRGGIFNDIGYFAIWWSQTEESESYAWRMYLSYDLPVVYDNISPKHFGYSVRCLKN